MSNLRENFLAAGDRSTLQEPYSTFRSPCLARDGDRDGTLTRAGGKKKRRIAAANQPCLP